MEKDKSQKSVVPAAKKVDARPAAAKSDKPKKPNAIARWYRETVGELRKVNWPTPKDAWKLTKIVLLVMLAMSLGLGLLDFLFEKGILFLVQ